PDRTVPLQVFDSLRWTRSGRWSRRLGLDAYQPGSKLSPAGRAVRNGQATDSTASSGYSTECRTGRLSVAGRRGGGWSSDTAVGSWPIWGIQLSQEGRYQFHFPSSFMLAGSRTMRTIVASSRTAVASPIPASFIDTWDRVVKVRNTMTMTTAAAVT